MGDFEDAAVFSSIDSQRQHGVGLKNTSLSVLNQKKHHKTQQQRNFEKLSKQRISTNLAGGGGGGGVPRAHKQPMAGASYYNHGNYSHDGSFLAPPHFHGGSSSRPSLRSQSTHSFQHFPPGQGHHIQQQQQQQQQPYYQQHYSAESLAPPPPGQHIPQGAWSDAYHESSDQSLGVYSPSTSSDYTFEDTKLTSPQTSQSEWRESTQNDKDIEIEALRQELERLKSVELENQRLEEKNRTLHADNERLVAEKASLQATIVKEGDTDVYKELEEKKAELVKANTIFEDVEIKIADATQQLNKLKLVHKTTVDQKNKEISRLKEDIAALEAEVEQTLSGKTFATITPMSSPLTEGTVSEIPPRSPLVSKKDNNQQANAELIQDLLYTIRSLRSHNDTLEKEKKLLTSIAQREKRVLRALAHTSRNNVKTRKGLVLVSEVDTVI